MFKPAPLILFLVLLAVSCGKDDPLRPRPTPQGQIVFYVSGGDTSGVTHLFMINADGTGRVQITTDPMTDRQPRWSPDGKRIVFIRAYGPAGDSENVTTIDADGTNFTRLTRNRADGNPSWSPDGLQIAYQHDDELLQDVWTMNSDGSGQQLFMGRDSTNQARNIMWTSQGTFLGDEGYGIDMQLSPTATRLTRLMDLYPLYDGAARLSPDGTRIAFSWNGPNATHDPFIYTVKLDGSDLKPLTNGNDTSPVWSPDGTRIAFVRGGRIWVVGSDGANSTPLTAGAVNGPEHLGDWR